MRRNLRWLVAIALLAACGSSGSGSAHSRAERYVEAARGGDAGALRRLYANDRDLYEAGASEVQREESDRRWRETVEREIARTIARYEPLEDAGFHITYIPSEVVAYICDAHITTPADPAFTDDLQMVAFGDHWALMGHPGPPGEENLKRASETACAGA